MENGKASHYAEMQGHLDWMMAQEERQDDGIFYSRQILRVYIQFTPFLFDACGKDVLIAG